jgi:hypothetical protein
MAFLKIVEAIQDYEGHKRDGSNPLSPPAAVRGWKALKSIGGLSAAASPNGAKRRSVKTLRLLMNPMPDLQLLVGLHDVTLAHEERLETLYHLLDEFAIKSHGLLVVPNWQGCLAVGALPSLHRPGAPDSQRRPRDRRPSDALGRLSRPELLSPY